MKGPWLATLNISNFQPELNAGKITAKRHFSVVKMNAYNRKQCNCGYQINMLLQLSSNSALYEGV